MSDERKMAHALIDIERDRQDVKWGVQDHDPFTWLAVLNEEVGEYAKEALEIRYDHGGTVEHLREECVQVAAVAMAMVECIDRGAWRWP